MDFLLIVLLLGVNGLISWWNCRAVGQAWVEVNAVGGFWMKAVVWSGAFQAVVGFSMIYLFALCGLLTLLAPVLGITEIMASVNSIAMSFWYLLIIIPALGTGYILTVHSWIQFAREKSLGNLAGAGWNTFASVYNTYNAIEGIGQSAGVIGEAFSSALGGDGDARAKIFILGVLLAVLSLVGGYYTARYFILKNAATLPLPDMSVSRA